jgi:hypothetical protein
MTLHLILLTNMENTMPQVPTPLDIYDIIATSKAITSEETRNAIEKLCRFVIDLNERVQEIETAVEDE